MITLKCFLRVPVKVEVFFAFCFAAIEKKNMKENDSKEIEA